MAEVSAEQQAREQAVTDAVVASVGGDARHREVLGALVRHLHGFAREVRLTPAEWVAAIEFLNRVGHRTDDRRQEFVLLSDVLGLSMLSVAIAAPDAAGATESTVLGPFFVQDAPEVPLGGDVARGAVGVPCRVSGVVRSTDGTRLVGARVDVWEADADGLYDVQQPGEVVSGRGWLRTGPDGEYRFWCVRPAPYPIPDDGPVGELLRASRRGPMRPAHVHLMVTAPGHRRLVTHVFAAGDPYLGSDVVFGVKDSLVADFAEHAAGTAPDGRVLDGPWASVVFDLTLVRTSANE